MTLRDLGYADVDQETVAFIDTTLGLPGPDQSVAAPRPMISIMSDHPSYCLECAAAEARGELVVVE